MRMYLVQTTGNGDLGALGKTAPLGRAAAMSRRRALAAGRTAVAPARERVRTGSRSRVRPAPAARVGTTLSAALVDHAAPIGVRRTRGRTAVGIDTAADARLGRAFSIQRRRQMSQGKQALNAGGGRPAAAAGSVAPAFVVHRGGGG